MCERKPRALKTITKFAHTTVRSSNNLRLQNNAKRFIHLCVRCVCFAPLRVYAIADVAKRRFRKVLEVDLVIVVADVGLSGIAFWRNREIRACSLLYYYF